MKKLVAASIVSLLFLSGCGSASNPTVTASVSPTTVAASPTTPPTTPSAEDLLSKVYKETEFEPMLDTWGQGKALFMAESGWNGLSEAEKTSVIDYVQKNGGKAIVVGNVIKKSPKNTVSLDKTVWGE